MRITLKIAYPAAVSNKTNILKLYYVSFLMACSPQRADTFFTEHALPSENPTRHRQEAVGLPALERKKLKFKHNSFSSTSTWNLSKCISCKIKNTYIICYSIF